MPYSLDVRPLFPGKSAEFDQGSLRESASENIYLESMPKLKATLIGELSPVASFAAKNDSDVLVGTEKTDTRSVLPPEYAFRKITN
jgi:hypothetical protein